MQKRQDFKFNFTGATDKPVEELVQDMQSRIKELTRITDEIAQKLAGGKQAPVAAAPIVPLSATQPYGFLLPARPSTLFNAASGVAETKALPSDLYRIANGADLEDFRNVMLALANPETRDSNRKAIYVSGKPAANDGGVDGKAAKIGFDVSVVTASNAEKALVDLYIIEDKVRGITMIAGPERISPKFQAELAGGGIHYVSRDDANCTRDINEFLAESAMWRSNRGKLIQGSTQSVIWDMISAFETYIDTGGKDTEVKLPGGGVYHKGTTLGAVITEAPRPTRSVQITRPK